SPHDQPTTAVTQLTSGISTLPGQTTPPSGSSPHDQPTTAVIQLTSGIVICVRASLTPVSSEAVTTSGGRCLTLNAFAENVSVVEPEGVTEITNGVVVVVGLVIRTNGTGWTPVSQFSSLVVDFRHPVELSRIRLLADNLKEWRFYYQTASDVFPRWKSYFNSSIFSTNDVTLSSTLDVTKIRITPVNSGAANIRLEVFGCFPHADHTMTYTTSHTFTTSASVTCTYPKWTEWTSCTHTCGLGVQIRQRSNTNINVMCDGPFFEQQACFHKPCPCVVSEVFFHRVFNSTAPSNVEVGYIEKDGRPGFKGFEKVFIGDIVNAGTVIRTKDDCITTYCTSDGLKTTENQCVANKTKLTCDVVQYDQKRLELDTCVSRESIALERCAGFCDSHHRYGPALYMNGAPQLEKVCKCCSVDQTYKQTVAMDCTVNGTYAEKTITISRIRSCQCDYCQTAPSKR
ncbi:unnamed protein product, partial [Didymodactylos carnosus]